MSILYRGIRPVVAFDVRDAQHRRWFAEFVKYQTWGRCPVRFMAEALDQDLVSYISDKMLAYYVQQEFESGKPKTKNKSSTKPQTKGSRGSVRGQYTVQTQKGQVLDAVSKTPQTSAKELS